MSRDYRYYYTSIERGLKPQLVGQYCRRTVAFHRPHPQKETKPYAVRIAKEFLTLIEVTP